MNFIYCAKADRTDIAARIRSGELNVEQPFRFKSPQGATVDHSATKVYLNGDYENVRRLYAGIASVETIEEPEKDNADEEE